MKNENRKMNLQKMISVLLVCVLVLASVQPIMVRAEEAEKSPSGASDYYNARINTTCTLIEEDMFTAIKKVPRNTPIHLTGKVLKVEGETGVDDWGEPTYGTLVYVEVETIDGIIGWTLKSYTDQKRAETIMFAQKDIYLLSKANQDTITDIVIAEGEKITVESTQGDYSKIRTEKGKEGWALSSNLVKLEPKYLYITKKTGYYYNNDLEKSYKSGNSLRGLKGSFASGTKLEYVHTTSRDGLVDKVYEVITPTGELAFIDAGCASFQVPSMMYIQNNTTLYQDSTGKKKINSLSIGTKVSRLFSSDAYYKVKVGNKTGWIKKADATGKKVANVKKSYGTYYLTQINYLKNDTYPAGTKILRLDNYFYESIEWKKVDQKKGTYVFIKGQYPDGTVQLFNTMVNGDVHKSKQKAITFQKDCTVHAKQMEKEIFKEFNQYRKSKGVKELPWDEKAYKLADSYFNYCVKIGATDFPHVENAYGWFVSSDDIIYSGPSMGINDTINMSKRAMNAWKRSAGHNKMLLDDRYYEGAAVAVMYNDSCGKMEAVIMCSKVKGKLEFDEINDNFVAKTWYPFIFKNPKFTNNRGDDYKGLNY